MINARLVLVSRSVYTFDVSKTMLEDKSMVSIHIRSRNTVGGRDAGCIACRTGARMCDYTINHVVSPDLLWV